MRFLAPPIGRGTRTFQGKDYFTIYDFVNAHENFQDPEWDGDPVVDLIDHVEPRGSNVPNDAPTEPDGAGESYKRPATVEIQLAGGKLRTVQNITGTSFWSTNGKLMSANEFIKQLYGELPELFKDEDGLRKLWSVPDTRAALLVNCPSVVMASIY